ncbi:MULTISPECIES: M1 family metallopeptidase [Chryseobacterium]|uniref:Aminopeptidase N n=1 Tax=Chryseobacterium camelliae TaxID=1265445 RepID=A0ABU0THA1_9FLAO|nr:MULTISPECIES: M1 family metallopeptidase [Chryseobacterium]MDT3405760.1 aminopeptidase N [Pseudacidovorax intermedius]MDQ1096432.1 aminopeptidase N [Chryseobacterium camelliae]MDQ1100373.1 aminopeptidase N [Chryseobacterium sp. SORGH_AS_1048]MDR6087714.1 aminopeptidase N [Chryseobacterium sp. SORGH_AS_0909]MDR6132089.1 aminopeptidase N [Chryseobacterium sp. SORGH_AS_1175]
MKKLTFTLVLISGLAFGQLFEKNKAFTKQDTLKGSNTKFRDFWDVKKYDLSVEPDFDSKSIKGNNTISLQIIKDITNPVFQIDLQQPMKADKVQASFPMEYQQDGDFIFITAKKGFKKGEQYTIDVQYSGNPRIAKTPPWDGGWIFTHDEKGNPWMSVADEGIGASVWLPTKDIWSDEPDQGIIMKIIAPKGLTGVGNGRLTNTRTEGDKTIYTWEVKNPINAYSIIPSIGKYANFKDTFKGEKGKLDLDYWVLGYNTDKAKKQFQQVKPMLSAFEYWFGPYPFYEDSYKLVETPYLGMEHQSNVGYGNGYQNGYLGRDLSGTGVGLNWDFIIIHESGHEWFANNITAKDQADMWIHESFTNYSEVLFTERYMDKKSAETYAQGIRKLIQNDSPIIGKYGVRNEGSGDMYPKGASMIHTIRQVINDDEKFRQILRGLNKDFYHQTVSTQQIEQYISKKSGIDFSSVFNQYLRTTKVPVLEYAQKGEELKFRYTNTIKNFRLPIRTDSGQTINPTEDWQTVKLNSGTPVSFDKNYYIDYKKVQ